MLHKNETIHELLNFIEQSPTSWHAVSAMEKRLSHHGFSHLDEKDEWHIQPGKGYYVTRNGSSLCAFVTPKKKPSTAKVVASHTDSPSFKLKPNPEFYKENMVMLGLEIYGSPLLTSWLNRDLGIAGRIVYTTRNKTVKESLVRIDKYPIVIPQLAIHLDRQANEQGPVLNKQEHLAALATLDETKKSSYLEKILKEEVDFHELLSTDLFLFPLDPPRLVGFHKEMISSYRIDSLGSVHAALTALIHNKKASENDLKMVVFWDNEEVGSSTAQGANSPFMTQVLERILLHLKLSREDYFRLIRKSLCVSVDLAHALHPNYPEKHEPRHPTLMDKGIVLKTNAQQRYASDAHSIGTIVALCNQHKIPFQKFVSRGDIPSGSTIGPIHATATGMPTVDIGCPQLSMHSCRELTSCNDHLNMCKLLSTYLS